jgi:glycosyltransferase involved in cell wall biosynthesis
MKSNIAYFTSCYPRASDSFIRNEVKELRKLGFKVSTFSVRKPESSQLVSEEIREEFQRTTYLLKNYFTLFFSFGYILFSSPSSFFSGFKLAYHTCSPGLKAHFLQLAYLIEACCLAKELKKKNINHLHNHIGEASATVAMLASKISGIPFSQTIHGPGIFYHPEKWALGQKIHHSSFTRCISHFCKSQCMAFANQQDWRKLHVIRCLLDQSFFSSPIAPIKQEPKLLTIGRLETIKGHFLLLDAAHRLVQKNIPFKLSFIGDGPLRKAIEEKIEEKNLENYVELLGWIGAAEVKKEIESSRAVVCASFNEGLPIVLMEALALGRPVIAPWISGVPELVTHGEDGYLFPAGSLEGILDVLEKILNNDTKTLEEMGKKGAEKINSEFNIAIEAKKLSALIANAEK